MWADILLLPDAVDASLSRRYSVNETPAAFLELDEGPVYRL